MAKSTTQTIVKATLTTLRDEGFAGATSRAIARRGGFNQALIFYHFGSLENLRLAAVRHLSEERLARYTEAVAARPTLEALVPTLVALWEEDKAAGHVRVVAQLIAGSANRPELAGAVVGLMEPWVALAETTFARVLPRGLPLPELAFATVVFYLGLNLITHLDPDDTRIDSLFRRGRSWAPLLPSLLAGLSEERSPTP